MKSVSLPKVAKRPLVAVSVCYEAAFGIFFFIVNPCLQKKKELLKLPDYRHEITDLQEFPNKIGKVNKMRYWQGRLLFGAVFAVFLASLDSLWSASKCTVIKSFNYD